MKYYYDLHIHSCLSPCGNDDMTPADIAGIGALNNLSVMALTDHNSCENCPAFFEACRFYGIIPIAGMELTTAEDIHIVCLFRTLDNALQFSDFVYSRIMPIKNNPEIFGNQNVTDTDGNILRTIDKLLISATDISVDELPNLISEYDGVCYPAHIDRDSNGIIAILGDIPPEPGFKCFEIHNQNKLNEYIENYQSLKNMSHIISSDAHSLFDINTDINFFEIPENYQNFVIDWIFNFIKGQIY